MLGRVYLPQNPQISQNFSQQESSVCSVKSVGVFSAKVLCKSVKSVGEYLSKKVLCVLWNLWEFSQQKVLCKSVKSVGEYPSKNVFWILWENVDFVVLVHFLLWQAAKPSGDKCTPLKHRSPSNRIPFAARSDCVRRPIRLRSVADNISWCFTHNKVLYACVPIIF